MTKIYVDGILAGEVGKGTVRAVSGDVRINDVGLAQGAPCRLWLVGTASNERQQHAQYNDYDDAGDECVHSGLLVRR